MSITIQIEGFTVTASSPAEAAEFIREWRKPKATDPGLPKTRADSFSDNPYVNVNADRRLAQVTLDMLEHLQNSSKPLDTEEIMDILGVSSPNAVGGTTRKINSMLQDFGMTHSLVYNNPKKQKERRRWFSASGTAKAIEILRDYLEKR
ncbi:MAG: hypothetical protein WD672_03780 [Woeseia sp.]